MNKKLLCSAIGTTFVLGAGAAFGGYALIPYVVKDANRTTVVTLIGGNQITVEFAISREQAQASSSEMHLQYWTKSITAANTAACEPSSVYVPITENDIVTFDTAGILGYPLFNDSTNPAPLGMAISYAAPRHGYLVVADDESRAIFRSYWMELDLANGGAHGDTGHVNNRDLVQGPAPLVQPFLPGAFNISDSPLVTLHPGLPFSGPGLLGGGLDGSPAAAVPFWPTSIASTVFTVTPLGSAMLTKENNTVVLQVLNSNQVQGAYDRNENGVDGTVPITVRCVGRVTPNQLMPGVVTNAAWAAQGGWGFLANLGDANGAQSYLAASYSYSYSASGEGTVSFTASRGIYARPDAAIYQVDQSTAGGKFMTNATRITSETTNGPNIGQVMVISDARLKRDIEHIGTTADGFGLYSFRYLWSDDVHTGVMAQEVMRSRPDAVVLGDHGFYRVDYGKLGLAHLVH